MGWPTEWKNAIESRTRAAVGIYSSFKKRWHAWRRRWNFGPNNKLWWRASPRLHMSERESAALLKAEMPECGWCFECGQNTTQHDHACLDSSTQAMAWKLLNQWVWNKGVIITMWGIYVESVLYSPTTLKLCLIDIFLCAHIRFKLLKRKLGLALNLSRMQC